jgi:eukaryotic-like serine/threonine-protein kinase
MSEAQKPADNPLLRKVIGGRFRIDAVIGNGAMGTVYRAKHLALDKFIALKVMHAHLRSDDNFVARFHREAKAASRLDHVNIMRVIDYGEDEGPDEVTKGRLFIAMELLDGTDLFQVIQDDFPLPKPRVVSIFRQLLAAVAAAHDAGIIHRDLKPENVMIRRIRDDDGEELDVVKVCDFGIAKMSERTESSYDDGRKLSVHGLLVGTPEYMSPEQARGETLDARSDVYSVGIMLYQMITSKLPFEGSQALDVALKQLADIAVPPHERYPGVDPLLEAVCLKALEKPPENRYQSAREMRNAFRGALEGRMLSSADLTGAFPSMTPPPAMSSSEGAIGSFDSSQPRVAGLDTPLGTERDARRYSDGPLTSDRRKATPLMVPMLGALALASAGYIAHQQGLIFPAATPTPVHGTEAVAPEPAVTSVSVIPPNRNHASASESAHAPTKNASPGAATQQPHAARDAGTRTLPLQPLPLSNGQHPRVTPPARPHATAIVTASPYDPAPPEPSAKPAPTASAEPQPLHLPPEPRGIDPSTGPDEH